MLKSKFGDFHSVERKAAMANSSEALSPNKQASDRREHYGPLPDIRQGKTTPISASGSTKTSAILSAAASVAGREEPTSRRY